MEVRMVDISRKKRVRREAVATGEIRLHPKTIELIRSGKVTKGNPIQIAQVAGVLGAKMTPYLIPLCHQIPIENIDVEVEVLDSSIRVIARVVSEGKTGVEMESLVAASVALLNIWDVVKTYEKDRHGQYPKTSIEGVKVISKVKKPVEGSRGA